MTEDEAYEMKINADRLWVVANTLEDLIRSLLATPPFTGAYGEFWEPKALPVYSRLLCDISGDVRASAEKALAVFD